MNLADAQIAVMAENQYQELELWYPLLRLREEGANVIVVGPAAEQAYASKLGYPVKPDLAINDVDAADFDAVVIPGGFAPEGMRRHKPMIEFVRKVHDQGALVAAICHAGMGARVGGHRQGPQRHLRRTDQGRRHPRRRQVRRPGRGPRRQHHHVAPAERPAVFCKEIVGYLKESPRIRNSAKVVRPTGGRAPSRRPTRTLPSSRMGPRGVASADYTGTVKIGDRVL